ncbi:MAG: sugar transferase [Sediminibacterium sp.]|uniref:sugar transferase n=1 Tax=Sediminibacterium sp. TaxID=1917865 RepID=UPI0027165832|nr:sugar transferase [Sediminibacterium sp.]MDO8997130.1 sugar transferase [Sediminibacterium sp.]
MTRLFDILFSLFGLIVLSPIILILYLIGLFDTGSPLFRQERVGLNQNSFMLLKFRSMHLNTKTVATHLVQVSSITKWGSFLRKSKLDELPQLFNVLLGDMSFVGPRPNLFNQIELIDARNKKGVYSVRPGITGLAQINKIDMSTPQLLAETDEKMIKQLDIIHYFKYIFLTIFGNGFGDRVKE